MSLPTKHRNTFALNARIEAARAGEHGAGFAVVAMEVILQTERSQKVNARVNELIRNLRALAGSTLEDLQRMNEKDRMRVEQCRGEVDESLKDLQGAHDEMKTMLTGMTEEGASLEPRDWSGSARLAVPGSGQPADWPCG